MNFTNNPFLDALIIGYRLTNPTINYFLNNNNGIWTATETAAFAQATNLWSEVANIQFAQIGTAAGAHFVESHYNSPAEPGNLGVHQTFTGNGTSTIDNIAIGANPLTGSFNLAGFGWDENDPNGGLVRGGTGFATIVHELGHAIGLNHPHETGTWPGVAAGAQQSPGSNGLNNSLYSIMSYRNGPEIEPNIVGEEPYNNGQPGGPMAFDIAAIQAIYGTNNNTRTGNDVYTLPDNNAAIGTYWTAIWDAGGNDTITYGGAMDAVIDLRAATLLDAPGGGGYASRAGATFGGFTIANNVTIENATGGTGNDMLTGNAVTNLLTGNGGNDRLDGGAGIDTMVGGTGNDIYVVDNTADVAGEFANQGSDSLFTSVDYTMAENIEVGFITAGAGSNVRLTGNASSNFLYGNSGNDVIQGGANSDLMSGGAGNDTYAVDNSSDAVVEAVGGGFDNVYSSIDYIINAAQEIESLILTAGATLGFGDNTANQIIGHSAVNVLLGNGGIDSLRGLGGDDIFVITEEGVGSYDVIQDFEGAGVAGGDRIAFSAADFGTNGTVTQVNATTYQVLGTNAGGVTNEQLFILSNSTLGTNLIAGDDFYFA